MRGSTYLPKVSLICDLSRRSATMVLKARVSRPISSREVTGTTVSSLPSCTALVPASRRRTGRDRPREKPPATRSPSRPARPVMTTTARTTLAWLACAASAAAVTIRLSSRRASSSLAVIILALGVERGQQGAQARRVGRGRQRLNQRRLPLRHVGTPLLEHLEQCVEARQGHGIPKAGAAVDLCADRRPRGRHLARAGCTRLVGQPAQLIAAGAALAVADVDVEPADVERALQRADVGAGQRGVAFDVRVPQDLQLAVDAGRHVHGQRRAGAHQAQNDHAPR